ncbi:MAG: hypothetical protein V7629_06515 [Motiliproteus sp.]
MADIKLLDVSLRDGNQSLWGATGLDTAKILTIAPVLDRVGFHAINFTSSTHMGMAVRTHSEDPWERIRLTHAAMPNTPLEFIGTGLRFISWERQSQEFMQLVYNRLVVNGIERFIAMDPMNDETALLTSAGMMRKAGASEIIVALTYTLSEVADDQYYCSLASTLAASEHVDRFYIKDPAGILTPERAKILIPKICAVIGDKPLELHSHCTIGLAPLTYMAAADSGAQVLQVACGPLANGTSLPCAERVVANLRELGHTVDINDRALALVSNYFSRMSLAEGLPTGTPMEFDAAFLRHQLPGGVISTTRRQLAELKLEDRFDAVMAEVGRVRAELGYPIMVTPFPQMVCTQALYNIISKERYDNVSDPVIRFVLGNFGRPIGPIDPDVKDKIMSRPRAQELIHEPLPVPLSEMRKNFPSGISDEEFLLRATMPTDQIEAMLAKGPAKRHYNPDIRSLIKLLGEFKNHAGVSDLMIDKPDFRLTLSGSKEATA